MAGRSDIQAGAAFVRLYVKNNELIKGLKSSGEMLKNWGTNIAAVGGVITGLGTSILGSLVGAASQFASSGDEINKMSQRTGASVEALSELRYAAGQSGASIQQLETGFKHMGKTIDEARQGSKEARETLARLGITFDELSEPPDAQLELFADRLSKIEDPGQRAALAMKVFGKSGTDLLPMFADGAKGIRALRNEAVGLGLSFGQDQADAATNLGDAWDRVKQGLAGAVFQIGSALAPSLTDLLGIVKNSVVFISNFAKKNKELIVTIAKVAVGLVAVGGIITAIGVGFIGAGAMLTGFATTIGAIATGISAAIGLLVSGPGLIAAAVAGGIAAFVMFTETGRGALDTVIGKFWELLDIGKETWGGIVNAIKAGDLALAGEIALAGLNLIWVKMTAGFNDAWIEAKFFFLSVWDEATTGIAKMFVSAFAGIQTAWVLMTSFLESTFDSFRTAVMNGWQSMQKGMGNMIIDAAEKSGAVSKDFAQAWRDSLNQPIDTAISSRTSSSATRQAEIEANKKAALARIEADRSGMQGILDQDKNRAQQTAFDAKNAALAAAQGKIDTSQADFDAKTKAAATAAEEAARLTREKRQKELESGAGIVPPGNVGHASAGTFSAAAALAFGGVGGGVQERIARNTEDQKRLAEAANATLDSLLSAFSSFLSNWKHS